jgi:HrpA-like RNA helicase
MTVSDLQKRLKEAGPSDLAEINRKSLQMTRRMESEPLPINFYSELIKEKVLKHQVLLLTGETGSGKSTQLPQILHELMQDK